jgi:hypothetical protein
MTSGNATADGERKVDRLLNRKPIRAGERSEVGTGDVGHSEIGAPSLGIAKIVNSNDGSMPDLAHGCSGLQKAVDGVSIRVSEHLDRCVAIEGQRASPIDHSHPTSTNLTDDFVLGVDYFARGELSVVFIEAGVLFYPGHCPQLPLFSVIDTTQKLANCRMETAREDGAPLTKALLSSTTNCCSREPMVPFECGLGT